MGRATDEAARLEALYGYQILDTPVEAIFDDFTQLAAEICQVPISLISLVDERRQWFKSKVGLDAHETPREEAFCAHALTKPNELLVVPDASKDTRFATNPLVTREPYIRFYTGAPLVTGEGQVLGTLCVIDRQPRVLTPRQTQLLQGLARQVMVQLEARRNVQLLEELTKKLERERYDLQLILDHVPAQVLFKDRAGRVLRVNRAVADALGLSASLIEGSEAEGLYGEAAPAQLELDRKVLESGLPQFGLEHCLQTGKRPRQWRRTDRIPVVDEQGVVERLLVVSTDITSLKETEQSLRASQKQLEQSHEQLEERVLQKTAELAQSQARYADLYEQAPDLYVSVDTQTAQILDCNQTFLAATGYSRAEVLGQPVARFYHEDYQTLPEVVLQEFRQSGRIENQQFALQSKRGDRIEVSMNVSAIRNAEGQIVASRSVLRDITRQKRLEEESQAHLAQLAHLARVTMMNEMATGIAHELNQPLQAIKNFAQGALLRLEKQAMLPGDLSPVLEDMVLEADRAAGLIASFRRFVQPSERRVQSVDPEALVARLTGLISREMADLGFPLEVRLASALPPVQCDTVQIEQVLINLIRNAADAMLAAQVEGEIRLIVEPTARRTVRLAVVDQGGGLAGVDGNRIFDAFYTTKPEGLGMGLPICKTIVEAHGGSLVAEANPEGGLTMAFELPVASGALFGVLEKSDAE